MKRLAINANGNTITSFAGELNPTGVGEYIYIYILKRMTLTHTHTHTHTHDERLSLPQCILAIQGGDIGLNK